MVNTAEDIVRLFGLLHDGVIVDFDFDGRCLALTVEIRYLVQRMSPAQTCFRLVLDNVSEMTFTTWPLEDGVEARTLKQPEQFLSAELEILSAEARDPGIRIVCNQTESSRGYVGGELDLRTDGVSVSDEAGKPVSLKKLVECAEAYWREWRERL